MSAPLKIAVANSSSSRLKRSACSKNGEWPHSSYQEIRDPLIAAAVILPVTARNRITSGQWVAISANGGINFYLGKIGIIGKV